MPTPDYTEGIEPLGLLEFLSIDPRPAFIAERQPHGPILEAQQQSLVFANEAFRACHPALHSLLTSAPSDARQISDPAGAAWLSWVYSAQNGHSYDRLDDTWTLSVLRGRWHVYTNTALKHKLSEDISLSALRAPLKAVRPSYRLFDAALSFGSISKSYHASLVAADWTKSSLGPVEQWPAAVQSIVSVALATPSPCSLFYGPNRDMMFNEAYLQAIKTVQSTMPGSSAKVAFGALFAPFEALMLECERTGQPAVKKDSPVRLSWSDNAVAETYFSFHYIPLFDGDGKFFGIYNTAFETTSQVLSQRRMTNLLRIREATSTAVVLSQFWQTLLSTFNYEESEVPFAAIYTSGNSSDGDDVLTLEGTTEWPEGISAPPTVDLSACSGLALAIEKAINASGPVMVNAKTISPSHMPGSEDEGLSSEDLRVVVCPLQVSAMQRTTWMVVGVKMLRVYDNDYKDFIDLLTRQVVTGASSVALHDEERRLLELTAERAMLEKQQTEVRFLEFAKHSPLGVYIHGPRGEIIYANDAWYRLLGIENGKQGEGLWRDRLHPQDLLIADATWIKIQTQGEDRASLDFRVRVDPDGEWSDDAEYRFLTSNCFAELGRDGELICVTGLIVDNTAQKAHERAASERLAIALEAKRTQENFMGKCSHTIHQFAADQTDMVSHEMRNPLNAIIQCAEEASLLLEPHVTDQTRVITPETTMAAMEAVSTILYCGNHQKQIIDDVLTVSKLDSNMLTLAPTSCKPISVAKQVIKIFDSEIRSSDIEVSITTDQNLAQQTIMFDYGRVLQILINLVGNAIKFLKGRPLRKLNVSVSVSIERPEPKDVVFFPSGKKPRQTVCPADVEQHQNYCIYYAVTDTGPGLAQHEAQTLFGRFKQASPKTHTQYGGSGLGLFISRELAELHAGEIGLVSKAGEGSTFAFYVQGYIFVDLETSSQTDPQTLQGFTALTRSSSTAPSEAATDIDALAETQSFDGTKVLIVEDNMVNQTVLSRQLRRAGFAVVTADNGAEALARLADTPDVEIVLCDLEMPIMDGLTCVKNVVRLREEGELPYIPMLAVTGNARAEQVQTARDAGFDGVACKPYELKKLVPLMKRLILGARAL